MTSNRRFGFVDNSVNDMIPRIIKKEILSLWDGGQFQDFCGISCFNGGLYSLSTSTFDRVNLQHHSLRLMF